MSEVNWFVLARWMVFLGVWIEASKVLFDVMWLKRHGESLGLSLVRPFIVSPERMFVFAILAYYANFLLSGRGDVLPHSDDLLVLNLAYAGYWLFRAIPVAHLVTKRGRRRADMVKLRSHPRPDQ